MEHPIIARIRQELVHRFPEALAVYHRFDILMDEWERTYHQWKADYPSSSSGRDPAWGLNAEEAAWCRLSKRFHRKETVLARGYHLVGQHQDGFDMVEDDFCMDISPNDWLRRTGRVNTLMGFEFEPTERHPEGPAYLMPLPVLSQIELRENGWLIQEQDLIVHNDTERCWDRFDLDSPTRVTNRKARKLDLRSIRSTLVERALPFNAYLNTCTRYLSPEEPSRSLDWELGFGSDTGDRFIGTNRDGLDALFVLITMFKEGQIVQLKLLGGKPVVRSSYVLPYDVLHTTILDPATLRVECRNRRGFELRLRDWNRAKDIQDLIEDGRKPTWRRPVFT